MNDNVNFTKKGFEQYISWQNQDKRTLKKINKLIADILRNGVMDGEGHPEPLRFRPGYSRHIDEANRLVYDVDNSDNLLIISCKGHYDDK